MNFVVATALVVVALRLYKCLNAGVVTVMMIMMIIMLLVLALLPVLCRFLQDVSGKGRSYDEIMNQHHYYHVEPIDKIFMGCKSTFHEFFNINKTGYLFTQ